MQLVINPEGGLGLAVRALAGCCGAEKKEAVVVATGETFSIDGDSSLTSFETAGRLVTRQTGSEKLLFPTTPAEAAEAQRWIEICEKSEFDLTQDLPSIKALSEHLLLRTFVVEKARVSAADVCLYVSLHKFLVNAAPEALQTLIPLLRWFDHMQSLEGLAGVLTPQVDVVAKYKKPVTASKPKKAETKKAEAKKTDTVEPGRPLDDPTRLELRVGRIIEVWHHPGADALYCEKIDIGESQPRQIASGLRKFIPIEKMKDSMVVVFANLKEKSLRKFPSHGMVLCAKSADGETVEFVTPPTNAKPGDQVKFEGLEGDFEPILSAKKDADALTAILPGLRSDDSRVALYKDHKMVVDGQPCTCATVANGTLS